MGIVAGLDVGTTGCKLAVYDQDARLLDVFYSEYESVHSGGQHEIDFTVVKSGVMDLLKKAVAEYDITAIGITSFGETFAMLDENDNVLAPSMLYTDPRGKEECDALCKVIGTQRLTLLTGVKPHQMYSISKIAWHKNNVPEIFPKCKRILLGEDFIVYTLTGNAVIDYTLAARTGAFDVENKCWITEIFEACGVDVSLMSKAVETGNVAGNLKAAIKEELGIDHDIAIINGCHDQVAAMMGAGVFDDTTAMDGTGTVECIPVILNKKPEDISFYAGGYSVVPFGENQYACYALSYSGGATLKWFRDNFAELEHKESLVHKTDVYAELNKKVKKAPTDILVLPHFAGAATPYMDNDSKAVFVGVTLETDKIDIYKALMEGTAYEILLNFNTMKAYTGEIAEIRATGGGAKSDVWLQIKADILDREITALDCAEVGAAGTAAIAGHAVGVYDDIKSVTAKMAPVRKIFIPNKENNRVYTANYQRYKNLYQTIKTLM